MPDKQREPEVLGTCDNQNHLLPHGEVTIIKGSGTPCQNWNPVEAAAPAQPVATSGYVQEVRRDDPAPSCHRCGALMVPNGFKCLSCKAMTKPAQLVPRCSNSECNVDDPAKFVAGVKGACTPWSHTDFHKHSPASVLTQPSAEPNSNHIQYWKDRAEKAEAERPVLPVPPNYELEHMKSQRDYLQRVCSKIQAIVDQSDLPDRSSELDVLLSSVAILAARASSPAVALTQQVELIAQWLENEAKSEREHEALAFRWAANKIRDILGAAAGAAGRMQVDAIIFNSRAEFEHIAQHVCGLLIRQDDEGHYVAKDTQAAWTCWRAALRESAREAPSNEAPRKPTNAELDAAKIKLRGLWCYDDSGDFTQWLAEKAIELFAMREASSEAPDVIKVEPIPGAIGTIRYTSSSRDKGGTHSVAAPDVSEEK